MALSQGHVAGTKLQPIIWIAISGAGLSCISVVASIVSCLLDSLTLSVWVLCVAWRGGGLYVVVSFSMPSAVPKVLIAQGCSAALASWVISNGAACTVLYFMAWVLLVVSG